jgi:hypothetical protein
MGSFPAMKTMAFFGHHGYQILPLSANPPLSAVVEVVALMRLTLPADRAYQS